MIKRKITTCLLIACLVLTAALTAGCGSQAAPESSAQTKEQLADKISSKIDAYKTDLLDSQSGVKSNSDIREYLTGWAKAKGVSYTSDDNGNVIMKASASAGYKEAQPVVICCPYDADQYLNYTNPIALSLYTIKNYEKTAPLTVIFIPERSHEFTGIRKLSSKYFTDESRVICLNDAQTGGISLNSGAGSLYEFSHNITRVAPEYSAAYKISFKGIPTGQPGFDVERQMNPITRLNSLLASMKNKNISYEIADFHGGISSGLYAPSASMTIVIDQNKEEKFTEMMDKSLESFSEKHAESDPEMKYTYKKVKTPAAVISGDDRDQFVSFMYTLLDGKYYTDDDGNLISITNISKAVIGKDKITVNTAAYSLSETSLKEIDTDEKTLASLSNINFRITGTIPMWRGNADDDYTEALADAYKASTGKSLTYTDSVTPTAASYVQKKNSKAQIISMTLSDNILKDCTQTVIRYLIDSGAHTDEGQN